MEERRREGERGREREREGGDDEADCAMDGAMEGVRERDEGARERGLTDAAHGPLLPTDQLEPRSRVLRVVHCGLGLNAREKKIICFFLSKLVHMSRSSFPHHLSQTVVAEGVDLGIVSLLEVSLVVVAQRDSRVGTTQL